MATNGDFNLAVDAPQRVGEAQLGRVLPRQPVERQQFAFGRFQQPGDPGRDWLEPVDDLDQPLVGRGEAGGANLATARGSTCAAD